MTLKELQMHLDIQKWHESENHGEDMCRKLPHCQFCKGEEEYPCAKAYNRMAKADGAAEEKPPKAAKKPAAKKAKK